MVGRMTCHTALVALSLAQLLSGCTVGPDFVPPKAETPSRWTMTDSEAPPVFERAWASAVNSQPIANASWWTSFNDPKLTSLIERAAASNLDMRLAALRLAEARAQRDIAAADQWPSLSVNGSYARGRISENSAGGAGSAASAIKNPFDQFKFGFDASWEIDLFGRVGRSIEAAEADTEAAAEDNRDVLVSLLGDVARTYIDLRGARLSQSIIEANLKTQRESLELAQDRRRAGFGTDLDIYNASAQVATSEAQLPALKRRQTQDINQISLLLAQEPGALRTELDILQQVPSVPSEVPIGLPSDLLRRRPDIRRAEAQLHAATARIGVATADLFPHVALNASVGFQAQRFANLTDWASHFVSIGPSLELPIFDGGRRRATVRLEDVKAQEAAINYAQIVLKALHEVENAFAAYGLEQARRASLETALAENRDALALAQRRYESGVSTFLEVLDTERNLQQTELALAESITVISTDLVALYKALGGGWEIPREMTHNTPVQKSSKDVREKL